MQSSFKYYIPSLSVTVPIDEIVDVTKITGRKDDGGFEVVGFTISYIQHQKNFILRTALTQFLGSPEQGEEWSTKIQEALDQGMIYSQRISAVSNKFV